MLGNCKLWVAVIGIIAVILFPFYPPNVQCKQQGGVYFLNGQCGKFHFDRIEVD